MTTPLYSPVFLSATDKATFSPNPAVGGFCFLPPSLRQHCQITATCFTAGWKNNV